MAAHTSLLLVIALCAATAVSLRCYSCSGEPTYVDCLKEANCSRGERYCQTLLVTATVDGESLTQIDKRCMALCNPITVKEGTATGSCCKTDLCNYNSGATIRSSRAAILLALGSVLIILKSSVL